VLGRSWRILPRTKQGVWAIGLIVAMPILFVIGLSFSSSLYESVPAGRNLLADVTARPLLALAMLAGMAAGISAFIIGILAIFKHKENAFLVYLSTTIGGLTTLLLVGQLVFPQ
jgi:hypothetical protein